MNLQTILERFVLISGIPENEVCEYIPMCEDAQEEIASNLKSGADISAYERKLNVAAATLAFYKYTLCRASGGNAESFAAGELRIKNNLQSNVNMAYRLWMEAKKAISPILEDTDFFFERI
ncbi:MAG: hypothetical protein Q4B93_02615 [Clostridia bacterium]|nr:hypothetical protein [Clostridia bacterium]